MRPAQNARWRQRSQVAANHSNIRTIHDVGDQITQTVSAERLERFFVGRDDSYQVNRELRQMCIFSKHNLLQDPPFPELDLISCRNLLIYLEPQCRPARSACSTTPCGPVASSSLVPPRPLSGVRICSRT